MDLFEKYYTLALRYLQIRQRSEKEVVDYLKKKSAKGGSASGGKKTPEEIIIKIIEKLRGHRFLDDTLFAKLWVESRNRSKPRSKWLLSRELQQKGIAKDIIENLLGAEGKENDLALAKEAIGKRIEKYGQLARTEVYQKVGGFLARRGFDWETSKRAIDELLKDRYNTDE